MIKPAIYFDEVNERQATFHRRVFLFGGVTGVGLLALAARLGDLQILEADRYKLLSEHNEFEFRLTPPPRGLILDRDGVVLASNRPAFRLLVATDQGVNVDETLANLARLVPMNDARRARLAADIAAAPRKAPVAVVEDISWQEFSSVNVRAPELPGVTADMGEMRVYPYGGAFAHVIGYVAKVNEKDITKTGPNSNPILLNPGFRIGRQGVEKAYDLALRGKAGAKKVEVDVKGRVVRDEPGGDIPAIPGEPLRLTLDADIQNRAMDVFGDQSGAAVMLDCRTGDILCMASAPSFDANRFVKGLTAPEYKALAEYDRKPLFNKALTATYPPGSTFKTMVALTALEAGVSPDRTYVCNKVWFWGGRAWHCDSAHGVVDMHNAIKVSCDIFFYQTALALGPDPIAATARKFGLGQIFDLGISGQKAGIVPDRAYKRRAFPHDPVWHPGETPSMGIGQGYLAVNALQEAVMVSRLANGVRPVNPRLVQSIGDKVQPEMAGGPNLPFDPAHIAFVRAAMASVVNDPGGTAFKSGQLDLGPVKMAGKTGTAQSHDYKAGGHGAKGAQGAWAQRDHAWFIAFAPIDDPRYAMSVLVEHGGWGADAAAPKAVELMKIALLKDPAVRARIVSSAPGPVQQGAVGDVTDSAISRPGERDRLVVKLGQIDWLLCALLTAITGVGTLMLYSIAGGSWDPWADRQLGLFAVCFVAMIALAVADLRIWFSLAYPIYAGGLVLLIAAAVVGHTHMGAQRWLDLGPVHLQPSEIIKIGLVLALARFYHSLPGRLAGFSWWLLIPAVLTLVPAVIVAHQPDLGTAILIAGTGGIMMILAGLSLRLVGVGLVGLAASAPVVILFGLKAYQRARLLTFLHPEADRSGAGYHIIQSKIALGSGGLLGKGFGLGTQSQLNFLPEKSTDFMFASLAEQFGFVGCATVLVLYAAVIVIGLRIAGVAHSHFGRMAASGVIVTFTLCVLINGAMVMGLAPVVGVPMPFLSYGGTVMITMMAGFALILAVRVHRYSEVTSGRGALV